MTKARQESHWAVAIHGGAGLLERSNYSENKLAQYRNSLNSIIKNARGLLEAGASAIEVVCESVAKFEDDPLFNAGVGAVFNHAGEVELDAALMDGSTQRCGGVSIVKRIKNPIYAAKEVLMQAPHCLLAAQGAEEFARQRGLEIVENSHFYTDFRKEQLKIAIEKKQSFLDHSMGTVGAVALDHNGNLAAATSTGGMTNKFAGRISDSSLNGAGNYANNLACAVSGTGNGEFFIRRSFAHDVFARMHYASMSLQDAINSALDELANLGGEGGAIGVSAKGEVFMNMNTSGMFRACESSRGQQELAIF